MALTDSELVSDNQQSDFDQLVDQEDTTEQKNAAFDNEQIVIADFNLFPNPNNGVFNMSFSVANETSVHIEIINSLGQLVYTEDTYEFLGFYQNEFSLVNCGSGVYSIVIVTSEGTTIRKMILN